MTEQTRIAAAVEFIAAVPGYVGVADDLSRAQIRYDPRLPDRGQATLGRAIILGPEPFADAGEMGLVSLAGTLVHEHWHTRQNPFLKTVSFWLGVFTRTHPMRRYEWPAYQRQLRFLDALAAARPSLTDLARQERRAILSSFRACYGPSPSE